MTYAIRDGGVFDVFHNGKLAYAGVPTLEEARQLNSFVKADHYFHGDACKYTGKEVQFSGGLFYEYEIIEGHSKGRLIHSQKQPAGQPTSSTCWQLAYQQGLRLLHQHYGNKEAI